MPPSTVFPAQPDRFTDDDVADGLAAIEATMARPDLDGYAIVDGFGGHVGVDHGELRLRDGIGPSRRERRYPMVGCPLRRLLIGEAAVTTAALRWCAAAGVAVAVLDVDREALLTSTAGRDDCRVRRQQAVALDRPVGLAIAKLLLGAKLAGQEAIARRLLDRPVTGDTIESLAAALEVADDVDECRSLEAAAAESYFSGWRNNPACALRFARADMSRGRVPAHWLGLENGRRSLLGAGASNRRPERPLNSMLSLGYFVAAAEARVALAAVGCDPSFGVIHLDKPCRDGMVYDLLEVARPAVDHVVLRLAAERTFRRSDFWQGHDGACRVLPPLSHDLAIAAATAARGAVAPHAEKIAHLLSSNVQTKIGRPTPLTGSARRAAQAKVKARKQVARIASDRATRRVEQRPASMTAGRLAGCVDCGAPVTSARRVRCDACLAADPGQTPEIRDRRARAISARKRAFHAQADAGLPPQADGAWYRQEILPRLRAFKLADIMRAAGISKGFASQVRSGEFAPHVSVWRSLAELVGVELPRSTSPPDGTVTT
jgi:CRISPR-associated endonuclease Cas1